MVTDLNPNISTSFLNVKNTTLEVIVQLGLVLS